MLPVYYLSADPVLVSQQFIRLADISLRQLFPDIGAADLAFAIHRLFNDRYLISIFRCQFPKQFSIALPLVAKMAVRTGHDRLCAHLADQNLGNKLFRVHMCDFLVERIFHQILHPRLAQVLLALLVGRDHRLQLSPDQGSRCRLKGKHRWFISFFPIPHHFPQQLLMPSVKTVKLTDRDRSRLFYLKFSGSGKILHLTLLPERSYVVSIVSSPADRHRDR